MKILLAQPSIPRFQWELEVLLTNIRQWVDLKDVILLFKKEDDTVPPYLYDKYGVQCFVYEDMRVNKGYIPSIRPYLWYRYLENHPEAELETYFYIDSDIIFREWPDLDALGVSQGVWAGSDCDGYIGHKYITSCTMGEEIAAKMAGICDIDINQMKGVPGIGAQLVISHPTAAFWLKAYNDSNDIYDYFKTVNSNIQKWTAEMWAQLWGMVREGKTLLMPAELDFCRPTDPIAKWDQVKIMHNAGVMGEGDMFYKGAYISKTPFGEDFSRIDPGKVSSKYVAAIQEVVY